jgi:hypothetical protein
MLKNQENNAARAFELKSNTLLLLNARAFEYEIRQASGKTVLITNLVPGPAQPPVNPSIGF